MDLFGLQGEGAFSCLGCETLLLMEMLHHAQPAW